MAAEDLLFQEIDEELKVERLRLWWQRFGSWVVGCCVLAVLGTVAYQYDKNQRMEANQQVTASLLSSNEVLDRGQYESAAKSLLELPEKAGEVALLARLKAAHALEKAGKHQAANVQYEAVMKTPQQPALSAYATLQLGQFDAIKPDAPFAPLAQEIQAIELFSAGKKAEAQKLLEALVADPESSATRRNRANELLAAFQ